MIESKKNQAIKRIQKLKKSARVRRKEQAFVVEGWKMSQEALERQMVEQIYVSESAQKEFERKVSGESLSEEMLPKEVEIVSDPLFRELSDTVTPQGILAVVKMPEYDRMQILAQEDASLLCLEDIQDPGNLGTMIRTAEGAGMSGVVLSAGCVDLYNPKVVRSTMGALFRVPTYLCEDMSTEVELLKDKGYTFYAAHLQGDCDYTEKLYEGRVGVLIGNEANGLSDSVTELSDYKVRIPMEGELESLNAAVSAGLLMYEIHRKR